MNHNTIDPFIQQLQDSTETVSRLGFLSAIIPIFLPFVFGISVHRARQCGAVIQHSTDDTDPRISHFRSRFVTSAFVSGAIMLGLFYWVSTLIWNW